VRRARNIKTRETKTIKQLKQQTRELEQKRRKLEQRITLLMKNHRIEEDRFRHRLEAELTRLKDKKPELFHITEQEQIAKLTVQLGISFIRWLFE
jgi:hypothetical protein